MNSYKLNKEKTKLIYEHQDSYGGCYHEISVKKLLRVLKPIIGSPMIHVNYDKHSTNIYHSKDVDMY